LTGDQLAEALGWPEATGRGKVSKIENDRQMPSETDIRDWATTCGHPELADELLDVRAGLLVRRTRYRQGLRAGGAADVQQNTDERTREATMFRNVETVMIPGLLQTSEYARAVYAQGSLLFGTVDVDAKVAMRMQRQSVLYDTGKTFEFVMTESALLLMPCSRQVMLGQLDRLLSLGMPNVTLGIIPLATELPLVPYNSFLLLDGDLIVETLAGRDEESAEETSALHNRIFDLLMAEARTGDDARRLIASAADRLR
jgi:hypothetical protein